MKVEEMMLIRVRRDALNRMLGYGPAKPPEYTIPAGSPAPDAFRNALFRGADGIGITVLGDIDAAVETLMDERPPRETYSEINMGGSDAH